MKPVQSAGRQALRLIKVCLNETCSRVWVGKHLSDMFPIRNGLKQDVFSPLLFIFASESAKRRIQVNQNGSKLNGTHQRLFCVDDVNILGGSVNTIEKNTEALVFTSNEIGIEVNADKTKFIVMSEIMQDDATI